MKIMSKTPETKTKEKNLTFDNFPSLYRSQR